MKGVKELGKYLVKVFSMILAVLMTAGFFLIPPALAAEDTANYHNMRFALYPEEESTEKSVVLRSLPNICGSSLGFQGRWHAVGVTERLNAATAA